MNKLENGLREAIKENHDAKDKFDGSKEAVDHLVRGLKHEINDGLCLTSDRIRDWAVYHFGENFEEAEANAYKIRDYLKGKEGQLVSLYQEVRSSENKQSKIGRSVEVGVLGKEVLSGQPIDEDIFSLCIELEGYVYYEIRSVPVKLSDALEIGYPSRVNHLLYLDELMSSSLIFNEDAILGFDNSNSYQLTAGNDRVKSHLIHDLWSWYPRRINESREKFGDFVRNNNLSIL